MFKFSVMVLVILTSDFCDNRFLAFWLRANKNSYNSFLLLLESLASSVFFYLLTYLFIYLNSFVVVESQNTERGLDWNLLPLLADFSSSDLKVRTWPFQSLQPEAFVSPWWVPKASGHPLMLSQAIRQGYWIGKWGSQDSHLFWD